MTIDNPETAREEALCVAVEALTADIRDVGRDTDYVPGGDHARAGHPNVEVNDE